MSWWAGSSIGSGGTSATLSHCSTPCQARCGGLDLQALRIGFVTLGEGIDTTTAAGRLQLHVLSAISQFERDRIAERVRAGLARARMRGTRLGRPRKTPATIAVPGGSVREAARIWGVSKSTAARRIAAGVNSVVGIPDAAR